MKPRSIETMLERETIANRPKHWVRAVTACNSRCIFCLDSDTPRNVFLSKAEVESEIDRGRALGAEKLILSGGEASLHPRFEEFISYARSVGYDRVQTVTNGYRFQDRAFFEACMQAGLGEITFSLHGHTPELHDRLTRTAGAFEALIKGMVRALRDGRPIVNVDVVINRQNVASLDKIVELCISLGVTEFDLLHVIPQAAAFENRADLFYDVREHLPVLRKVFRLARHPNFTVWTNRFPISYLEGLEDLIQDPHKMLDEVNGRRFHLRRYLDLGTPLECRQKERCEHCFIEPFCTTVDRVVAAQNTDTWEVWWVGRAAYRGESLPFGCTYLGVEVDEVQRVSELALPAGAGVYVRPTSAAPLLEGFDHPMLVVATTAEQLDSWLSALPVGMELEIHLNRSTAPWLIRNRAAVLQQSPRIRLHQPTHEHMKEAHEQDVRAPAEFFRTLDIEGVRVSGLPACLAPNATLIEPIRRLDRALFDHGAGRLDLRALARYHVSERYFVKSERCADCRVRDRCDGLHINMVRDQGLTMLQPLVSGTEAESAERSLVSRYPEAPQRLATGRLPEAPAKSLPGYAMPTEVETDPLALIEVERLIRKQSRERRLRDRTERDS